MSMIDSLLEQNQELRKIIWAMMMLAVLNFAVSIMLIWWLFRALMLLNGRYLL